MKMRWESSLYQQDIVGFCDLNTLNDESLGKLGSD